MNRTLLPLAFVFIITSCGEYSGDLPAPRTPVDAPAANAPAANAPAANAPAATAAPVAATKTARKGAGKVNEAGAGWYERRDLGAIVLKLDDGAKENMREGDQPRYRRESYDPGLGAYQRRLAVLRREQKRLLGENARLREQLQSDSEPATGTAAQLRELRELQSWLAQLSAGQAEVTAHTHAVTEAHGALLTQLRRALPEQLAQLEQP